MKIYTTRYRIVEFIRNFIEDRGYAPTVAEIQKALGISSSSVVEYHLKVLVREGIIRHQPEVARSIEVAGVGRRARAVPLLGTIAAGEPIPVPTEETWYSVAHETVEVPAEMLPKQVQAYALRVKGTSMIDAFVDDGDIVVLEATSIAEDGEMVAAWLPERHEATLKKLYREPGRIRLQPANQSMAPLYVRPHEVQVQGRVIGVLRKYSQGSPTK
jgi:repressor LexA